jgi:integrase
MAERRAAGKRGGDPALYGKNVERRRDTDDWFYKFRVNGIVYGDSCNTKNKAEAEKLARDLKTQKKLEARKDREAGLGPMRFGAACDVWWNEEGSTNLEGGLKYRLDWLCEKIGESKLLGEITPDDITRVKNGRAECTRPAGKDEKGNQLYRPLTPATVKATLVTLRAVLNYASKAKGAAVRMFDWPFWIRKDDEENDIRVMSETEQALIWPKLDDDTREVAEFNLETPKRINEILPLTWPRVDLAGETIRIKLKGKTKLFDDPIGPLEVARLQTLKARRLHPGAVFTYLSERTREYNGVKHNKGERRQMTYQRFYEKWTEACARAGIADLNPHCLRHTGATRYYRDTGDIYTVSKMLNHASIATTVKYYAKHNPELVREMKRRVAQGRMIPPRKVSAKVSARLRTV